MNSRFATTYSDGVCLPRSLRSMSRHMILSVAGLFSRVRPHPCLRCVFCHYVFDDQVKLFEQKIDFLSSLGTFVSTEHAIEMIEGTRAIDAPYFHLSFDDGFKNIIKNALPVLVKRNIPSLFFVPTRFIDAPYDVVNDYCTRIAQYKAPIEMCSWDDLRYASESGMTIGSHTRTHARFSDLSQDTSKLRDELEGSKEDIEKKIGVSCETISWPFGRAQDADERSVRATKEAGYRVCFSAVRGKVVSGGTDVLTVPRQHFEAQWPLRHINYFVARA